MDPELRAYLDEKFSAIAKRLDVLEDNDGMRTRALTELRQEVTAVGNGLAAHAATAGLRASAIEQKLDGVAILAKDVAQRTRRLEQRLIGLPGDEPQDLSG